MTNTSARKLSAAIVVAPAYAVACGWFFRFVFDGPESHIGGIVVGCIAWGVYVLHLFEDSCE